MKPQAKSKLSALKQLGDARVKVVQEMMALSLIDPCDWSSGQASRWDALNAKYEDIKRKHERIIRSERGI
jgi:hypothetical protein